MVITPEDRDNFCRAIAALRAGHVEPMLLCFAPHRWWFAKFKALSTHPSPGNAGRGFSHPTDSSAFSSSHGDSPNLIFDGLSDPEIGELIVPLAADLGIGEPYEIQVARAADGRVCEVTLVRGGVINFEAYPNVDLPHETEVVDGRSVVHFGGQAEKQRVRRLRATEAKLPPVWISAAGRLLASLGAAKGGRSRSEAKVAAARHNAKLGGRPATTQLIFWVRRPGDRKDEAGATAEILVPQRVATRLARSLENAGTGMEVDDRLLARYRPAVDAAAKAAGGSFAGGHGISVVYPSGRTTEIRRKW